MSAPCRRAAVGIRSGRRRGASCSRSVAASGIAGRIRSSRRTFYFHGINLERFGGAVRRALGLAEASATPYVSVGLREIGTYAAAATPVHLSMEERGGLVRELTKLLNLRYGPFLVLTPTGGSWTAEVEALARPHAGGHVALSSVLNASPAEFKSKETIEPMLAEFARRVASLRDGGGTLRSIHRDRGGAERFR